MTIGLPLPARSGETSAFPMGRRIPTWIPPVGLALLTAALILGGRADLLRLGFPAGALAVGAWLFLRGPAPFLAFVWLLWDVVPGLRRIVDFRLGGWDPENPISLTPFLVSAIAMIGVIRRAPELKRPRLAPMIVAGVCIVYGYFVGVLELGILPATHALVSWLVPLGLGLYCAVEWRRYPEYEKTVRGLFLWGTVLLGAYGIYQFVDPPLWDRVWMADSGMYSIGRAFPYEVRVFSLVNAPLPFATILAAGLFASVSARGLGRVLAIALGTTALLLSLVRSVWLAAAVGLLVYLAWTPVRVIRRAALAGALGLALVASAPFVVPEQIGRPTLEIVRDRFLTLGDLHRDVSFRDRTSFLSHIGTTVAQSPLGRGLGSTGVSSTLGDAGEGIRDFDNGVLATVYSLGWLGGTSFLLAVIAGIVVTLRRREPSSDTMAKAARATVVTSLLLAVGANVFEGVSAAVLWGFLGLLTASHLWHDAARARRP